MDSYPSLIPIKLVFKIEKEDFRIIFRSEDELTGLASDIVEIPRLQQRMDLTVVVKSDEKGEEQDMFGANLTLLNIPENEEFISSFALYIKSANYLKYCRGLHTSTNNSCGVAICTVNELFNPENKFFAGDELVVEMKGIIYIKGAEMKSEKADISLGKHLWMDDDEKDFTIVVVEKNNGCKTQTKIHKCVLSARSPVFKRMFKTDMKEKQEGKVEIVDFDLSTVKTAVAFCYDQNIFDEHRESHKLFAVHIFADKYNIEDLKKQIEFYLVQKCSLENVCETANAAINLNAPKLQEFCFRFLLMALREGIPVKDSEILDKNFASNIMIKASSIEYL